uniref:Uncharacterized protein n=1 Tax=Salix viminalis TaxID=40686 RepID=A0A6N2N0Z1_SALVM
MNGLTQRAILLFQQWTKLPQAMQREALTKTLMACNLPLSFSRVLEFKFTQIVQQGAVIRDMCFSFELRNVRGNLGIVFMDSPRSTVCVPHSDMSETSTSFTIELGRNEIEKNHTLKRLQDFEKWMWKECFKSPVLCAMKYEKKRCTQLLGVCDYCHDTYFFEDSHCPSCHKTLEASQTGLNFSEHVAYCERKLKMDPDSALCSLSFPPRIRLLKLLLALIEASSLKVMVSVLPEALQPVWTNGHWKSWGMKLQS